MKSVIAVGIALVVVLVGGWFGDGWLRSAVEERVENAINEAYPGLHETSASVAGRFVTTQLVAGSLDDVTISAAELIVDGFAVTDITISAQGLPTRGADAISQVTAQGMVPTRTVLAAIDRRVSVPAGVELELRDGELAAVADILGVEAAAYATMVAQPRAIDVEVNRITLGGVEIAADQVPIDLSGILTAAAVSLEDLPPGVELVDMTVSDDGISLTLTGSDIRL
ncbi:MAG: DUF2993 domain-containing protein [Beutenbergiaceae bacterium]